MATKKTTAPEKTPKTNKKKKKKNSVFKIIMKTIAALFLLGIIAGTLVVTALAVYVGTYAEDDQIDLRSLELSFTTIIYYTDEDSGEDIELMRIAGEADRIWVSIDDMSQNLIDAAIALEDANFDEHSGVDWYRTIIAALNEVFPIYDQTVGGSTITQQVIKNVTGLNEVGGIEGYIRKLNEIISALRLETKFTKDDVMEAYLNTIPMNGTMVGVEVAANAYFGKTAADLSIAESCAILAVTQSPAAHNPFAYPENNKERREYGINRMLELGIITEAEHAAAMEESDNMVFLTEQYEASRSDVQSYFEDMVMDEVVEDMMEEYGYTRSEASDMVLQGGYRIYTTLDPYIQGVIESVYESEEFFEVFPDKIEMRTDENGNQVEVAVQPEGAMIIMDYEGAILGVVGGRGEKEASRTLNRAVDSLRPPGSTMKPIGAYALAFAQDLVTWSTILDDNPVKDLEESDGTVAPWPINYYESYLGYIPLELALQRSTNTIPTYLGELIGPQVMFDHMTQKLGISTLVVSKQIGNQIFSDIDLAPLVLGTPTDGISLLEMTAAYMPFGNGGYYTEPHSYTRVVDYRGNVILNQNSVKTQVYDPQTTEVMNKLLQRVVRGGVGTGRRAAFGTWQLAGKTGTASANTDHWWIGLTPYYVGGAWFGYDNPGTDGSGEIILRYSHPSIEAWRTVMEEIHQGLEPKTFPTTNELIQAPYCTMSGLLATDICGAPGMGYYKPSYVPGYCNGNHTLIAEPIPELAY